MRKQRPLARAGTKPQQNDVAECSLNSSRGTFIVHQQAITVMLLWVIPWEEECFKQKLWLLWRASWLPSWCFSAKSQPWKSYQTLYNSFSPAALTSHDIVLCWTVELITLSWLDPGSLDLIWCWAPTMVFKKWHLPSSHSLAVSVSKPSSWV